MGGDAVGDQLLQKGSCYSLFQTSMLFFIFLAATRNKVEFFSIFYSPVPM